MNKHWIYRALLFFVPLVLIYILGEYYAYLLFDEQRILKERIAKTEIVVSGSSQLREAVIPCDLSIEAVDLSFGNKQHLHDRLTMDYFRVNYPGKIRTVVLEMSYEHLEIPYRTKKSRQNYMYRFYNARTKDKHYGPWNNLLFFKRPTAMFKRYLKYNRKRKEDDASKYCDEHFRPGPGRFDKLGHVDSLITDDLRFFEERQPDPEEYQKNLSFFLDFLQDLHNDQVSVIIAITPKHRTYIRNMDPDILNRRDMAVDLIKERFPKIKWLNKEHDTINYQTPDFRDHNHLNYQGATRFTRSLDSLIQVMNR